MLTIEDVKQVSFRRASIGGYKPEDVDAFIDQVLITMEQMKKEKSELVKKMDILATRVEEYRADEDAVRNAMLAAQRVADSTIKNAKVKASQIVDESENAAKVKLYDLNMQIKEQKKQYSLLVSECNKVREELISVCNKHIILAKELPSQAKVQRMEKQLDERFPTDNTDDIEQAEEVLRVAPAVEDNVVYSSSEVMKENEVKAEAPAESVKVVEENIPAVDEQKEQDSKAFEKETASVDIIEDFGKKNNSKSKNKTPKSKLFNTLKFGDNYNIDSDTDNL